MISRFFGSFLFSVCLAISLCGPGCYVAPKIIEHPAKVLTRVVRVYHADTAFNAWERKIIQDSLDRINIQSNGLLELSVVYDLDWDHGPVSELARMEGLHQIVKLPSSAPIVSTMDGDRKDHNYTQGYARVDFNFPSRPTKVYIIFDRVMYSREMYEHVVIHELLHSVGVPHVNDVKAVMNPVSDRAHPQLCMNLNDAKALCKVYHCDAEDLNYCE